VIPGDALPSMPALVVGLNKAEINYQIKIFASKPGKVFGNNVSCVHSVGLDVVAEPPELKTIPRVEDRTKVMRCCCIPAGTMQLAAASSLNAIQIGDQPVITYEINNQTTQNVSYISISVERRVSWSAKGFRYTAKKAVMATRVAGVAQGDSFGFDTPDPSSDSSKEAQNVARSASIDDTSNGPRNTTLQVPNFAFMTIQSRYINVDYVMKIKAYTESAYVRNPEVVLPITSYRRGNLIPGTVIEEEIDETDEVGLGDEEDGGGDGDDNADGIVPTDAAVEYALDPAIVVQVIESTSEAK